MGNDVINVSSITALMDISGGNGNDVINVEASFRDSILNINSGSGDDVIDLSYKNNRGDYIKNASVYFITGNGNDVLKNASSANIYLDDVDLSSISFQVIGQGLKIKYSSIYEIICTLLYQI